MKHKKDNGFGYLVIIRDDKGSAPIYHRTARVPVAGEFLVKVGGFYRVESVVWPMELDSEISAYLNCCEIRNID